jgi:hypothetical protein
MVNFEKIKLFLSEIFFQHKKKREEKSVFYMQASGTSILKKSNYQDHAYMQTPMKQMGLGDKGIKLGSSQFGGNRIRK